MFKVGDKVRLKKHEIDHYWKTADSPDWSWDAPDVFVSGRVFTIVEIKGRDIKLGDGVGWWDDDGIELHELLPGDLFEI
jgi:hypothetical protein